MESKYINFPPLPLDTPVECIELAWLFVHLSKQEQEMVYEFLLESLKENSDNLRETTLVKEIRDSETEVNQEVQEFVELLKKVIGTLMGQSCEVAALVYQNYCVEKKPIEEIWKEFDIDKKTVEVIAQYYDKKKKS